MITFLAPLRDPLSVFLGGLGGASLAWLWFAGKPMYALLLLLIPIAFACYAWIRVTPKFIHDHPERAVVHYDRLTWLYIALTAVVAAASIILLVQFAWIDKLTDERTKQMLGALAAALTTFLGSILVTTDETDATIGSMVKERFIAAFGQADQGEITDGKKYATRHNEPRWYLEMGSLGLRAANEDYANVMGWGRSARRRRARDIEDYLRPKG